MIWKKDNKVWDGISIIYNNKRIFNPKEETLIEAGYEKVETVLSEEQIQKEY